jgi:hypothetical protein
MRERVDVLKNMSHIVYNGEYPFTLKRNTSLATLAFPGMENGCVAFIKEILIGYRMQGPEFSPYFIGEIMKNCWLK